MGTLSHWGRRFPCHRETQAEGVLPSCNAATAAGQVADSREAFAKLTMISLREPRDPPRGREEHEGLGQQSVGTVVSPMGLEQLGLISGFSYLLTMYYLPQSSKRSLNPNSEMSTVPGNNEHGFQKKSTTAWNSLPLSTVSWAHCVSHQ